MKFALTNHRLPVLIAVLAAAASLLVTHAIVPQADASRTVDVAIVDNDLNVKGTNGSDQLTLRLKAGDANVLEVDTDDDGAANFSLNRALFGQISVIAGNGKDLVEVDETNGQVFEPISIQGGNGDDTLLGGSGVDTIDGGNGEDFVDGNRGNDVASMGKGDDTFRWDPGDASDVVDGQGGADTLLFNGANGGETVELSAKERRFIFFRNPGNIAMDMNNVEISVFNALGGPDAISVNDLTGTDLVRVELNLDSGLATGVGDGLPDRVVVNGTLAADNIVVAGRPGSVEVTGLAATIAIGSPEFANDRLEINTLAGDDTVDASELAGGVIQLFVDP